MGPRENRISWDEHHMAIAKIASQRSPDPNTQVGACIVSSDNRVLATGYNAFPRGIDQNKLTWNREGPVMSETKYPYVVHAEANAIHNATERLLMGRLYVTLFPCNKCMQAIIQSGIHEVIYLEDKYPEALETEVSKEMADLAGVSYRKYSLP